MFTPLRFKLPVCALLCLGGTLAPALALAQGLLPPPRDSLPPVPEDAAAATPTFWPPPPSREPAPAGPPSEPEPAPPAEPVVHPPEPFPAASPLPPAPASLPVVSMVTESDTVVSGVRTHDGFYLRLGLGVGGLGSSAAAKGRKLDIGGGGLSLDAAAGWTVARNLIVFGELFGFSAGRPTSKANGVELSSKEGNANIDGLGAGVAYYLPTLNIFASGTLAISRFQLEADNGNTRYQSEAGLGLHFMVGKEWWVSDQWGIGVAATLMRVWAKDKVVPEATWGATAGGLAFVATYN